MSYLEIKISGRPINEGNFGQVARCCYGWNPNELGTSEHSGHQVVVKMTDDPEKVSYSIMEGIITASLNHPHIVNSVHTPLVHHIRRKRLQHEVAMEEVSAKPKFKPKFKLFKGPRPSPPPRPSTSSFASSEHDMSYRRVMIFQDEAMGDLLRCPWIGQEDTIVAIAYQLLNALYALHKERIIHGDVKPDNVLYYDLNRIHVRLADFTITSVDNGGENLGNAGSPSYMAPEILAEERWSNKIDIWSLGCTLYYLIYGKQLIPYQVTYAGPEKSDRMASELKVISEVFNSSLYNGKTVGVEKYILPYEVKLFEKTPINDLLMSMLQVNPAHRSTAEELLGSTIFHAYPVKIIAYHINQLTITDVPEEILDSLRNMCAENNELYRAAAILITHIWELEALIPSHRLIRCCASISYRILYGVPRSDYKSLADDEDIIFNYTGFRLLSIIKKK